MTGIDVVDHLADALAREAVREDERSESARRPRVALHDPKVGANMRREVDLVDDEQVGVRHAGPSLARDLVALGHVDDEDEEVRERAAERERQVVAAGLDEHDVAVGEASLEPRDRVEVHARVLAHRRVRARACLDADHPLGIEGARERRPDMLRVLFREEVVGDNKRASTCSEEKRDQRLDQRRLARAHGPADADARHARRSRDGLETVAWSWGWMWPMVLS